MNLHGVAQFLETQAGFCSERARNASEITTIQKYHMLADIYYTLAQCVLISMTPEGTHSVPAGKFVDLDIPRLDEMEHRHE